LNFEKGRETASGAEFAAVPQVGEQFIGLIFFPKNVKKVSGLANKEDVLILNNLLDEYSENWATALEQFTIRRLPDALALWEIDTNVFPASKTLFAEFLLRDSLSKVMNKLFPQLFSPPLRDLISATTLSYAEIFKAHKGWISKVKNSNAKLLKAQN